ncbi:MAG: NAD(P)-dependent oxidoreductase [Culicoidibacterales bacterium]
MTKIGFIGLGVMGSELVRHLLQHEYEVIGFTRTKAKAQSLIDAGMIWVDSPKAVATQSDVIFTMVGLPSDVEAVYFDEATGILAHAKPGTLLVDLTTSQPSLARRIHDAAVVRDLHTLDAPVTGGDIGAKKATLSIMVGGNIATYHLVYPLLTLFGQTITHFGPAGMGQHAKMANQIAIANNLLGMAELLAYANAQGIDPQKMLKTASSGSAASWQLTHNGAKVLAADFAPGFYVAHFIKDMRIAVAESQLANVTLPGVERVLAIFESLIAQDPAINHLGTQAITKFFEVN